MPVKMMTTQRFYGVGQGLFADGRIQSSPDGHAHFRWVYDCGTTSTQSLVDDALKRFSEASPTSSGTSHRINLVALSHFDHDHISGLVRLLRSSAVDTLLLPYVPLWQRLVLAFAEGIDTQQELFDFFVDPVEYISRQNTTLERVILVPGGRGERPGEPGATDAPFPTGDSPWNLNADIGEPSGSDQQHDASLASRSSRIRVEWLRQGGRLNVNRVWEFVPYNDAEFSPNNGKRFQEVISRRRDRLLAAKTDRARARALGEIKDAYDRAFGKSATQRNVISLFLYAGFTVPESTGFYFMQSDRPVFLSSSSSTLYTGDGYLDTPKRLAELTRFFGKQRMDNLGCLQVMHHGSRANWHDGVAAKLNPTISVFSSDPNHRSLGHPHAEVLRDFWPYGPVQVNKGQDIEFGAIV